MGKRVVLLGEILFFKLLIEVIYIYQIYPHYSYMGLTYGGLNIGKILVSYGSVLITGFFLPFETISLSRIFFNYAFFFLFVPISSIFWLIGWVSIPAFFVAFLFFLGTAIILNFHLKTRLISDVVFEQDFFLLILVLFSIATFLILLLKFGGSLKTLSLLNVYSARALYKEQSERFIGYLINWQGNVVNPYLFVYGFLNGNWIFFIFALLFQYYIFTVTGFRSIFFSFIFILWLIAGIKIYKKNFARFIVETSSIFFIFLIILYQLLPNFGIVVSSIGVRRVFYMPALVYYQYFDFFNKNPKDHFSRNFPFKFFYSSSYEKPIPYVIGEKYYKSKTTHVNGNLIADAFANFGYAGVFFVWIIFLIILKLMDDFTAGKKIELVISLIAMPFFSLTNMSIITVLMTHGLLLSLLLIYFHPYDNREV